MKNAMYYVAGKLAFALIILIGMIVNIPTLARMLWTSLFNFQSLSPLSSSLRMTLLVAIIMIPLALVLKLSLTITLIACITTFTLSWSLLTFFKTFGR